MMRLALLTLAFVVAACGGDDEPSTGGRLRAADASAPRDAGADSATSQEEEDTGAQPDAGSPPDDPEEPEESGEATYCDAEGVGASDPDASRLSRGSDERRAILEGELRALHP